MENGQLPFYLCTCSHMQHLHCTYQQPLLYTGGVFKALIHFSGDYNYVAPKVQFLTIPFHPNGEALHSVLLVRNNLLQFMAELVKCSWILSIPGVMRIMYHNCFKVYQYVITSIDIVYMCVCVCACKHAYLRIILYMCVSICT